MRSTRRARLEPAELDSSRGCARLRLGRVSVAHPPAVAVRRRGGAPEPGGPGRTAAGGRSGGRAGWRRPGVDRGQPPLARCGDRGRVWRAGAVAATSVVDRGLNGVRTALRRAAAAAGRGLAAGRAAGAARVPPGRPACCGCGSRRPATARAPAWYGCPSSARTRRSRDGARGRDGGGRAGRATSEPDAMAGAIFRLVGKATTRPAGGDGGRSAQAGARGHLAELASRKEAEPAAGGFVGDMGGFWPGGNGEERPDSPRHA